MLAETYGNVAGRTYSLGYLALAHLDEGDGPSAARRRAGALIADDPRTASSPGTGGR